MFCKKLLFLATLLSGRELDLGIRPQTARLLRLLSYPRKGLVQRQLAVETPVC